MSPTDELPSDAVPLLLDRSKRQVDNDVERGQIIFWHQLPIEQRGRARRLPRKFIAVDMVLVALSDLFEQRGVKRAGVSLALPGMQLVLPSGVDRPDTKMMIALGRDGQKLGVGCGSEEELRDFDLFVGKTYGVSWRLPVTDAVDVIRARARQHDIKLPKRFSPPASEPPLRIRGVPPSWQFSTADGRTSEWEPTHSFVQRLAKMH
jgi:hypothetical protein